MKRSITLFAIVFASASIVLASPPTPLTTLRSIHSISNAEAERELPVAFEATVSYFRGFEETLFVQDDGIGIFVWVTTKAQFLPGDRVLVRGTTRSSYRPIVRSNDIALLRHGILPKSISASFDDLIRGRDDSKLVTMRGEVRSADLELSWGSPVHFIVLKMLTDGGYIDAEIDSTDQNALKDLLDSEVEITGVAGGRFDGKMERTGVVLHVSRLSDLRILKRAGNSPWSLPITPVDEVLSASHVRDLTQRVHIRGTITYYQPGSAIVLQNGDKSLWITTQMHAPLRIGDTSDATGFPDVRNGFLSLNRGEILQSGRYAPISPKLVTWRELGSSKHLFDMVSIEGRVVMAVREASQDEYVLLADGYMFSAIFRRPDAADAAWHTPMMQAPLGSRVRVTGICSLEDSNPFNGEVPFSILMRTPGDISVVAPPSLLSVRNLILAVGLLFAIMLAAAARGWALERKVRRQTATMAARTEAEAAVERRRSRILEETNGNEPLAGILEKITEFASFQLNGAPCWCQIVDGMQLGNSPVSLASMRIVHREISARSGSSLGAIFLGFDSLSKPRSVESEILSMATGLAALAIETRRLYSDLRHRSEFDLLTDTHNRFSLDRLLDDLIDEARQSAGLFGLIYVDLDRFKKINDLYGHQVGDLFLQEASLRMKRQLRSGDTLARIGGDEFAALLPRVHNREDVDEVALRLEHCFDEPFVVEKIILNGSASLGTALYPQDATTKDLLFSVADTAMYAAKNRKRQIETPFSGQEFLDLTPRIRA